MDSYNNYSQIGGAYYQGGRPDGFEDYPADVRAVLNLTSYPNRILPRVCKALMWLPLEDGPEFPGVRWLETAVQFIEHCYANDWPILVHCLAGISRSSMVTVAYLMKRNRWTRDQALKFLKTKRPEASPNETFLEGLLLYEAALGIE